MAVLAMVAFGAAPATSLLSASITMSSAFAAVTRFSRLARHEMFDPDATGKQTEKCMVVQFERIGSEVAPVGEGRSLDGRKSLRARFRRNTGACTTTVRNEPNGESKCRRKSNIRLHV